MTLTKIERILVPLILAAGLLVRGLDVRNSPLWEDEAESSINALSILEHGVPQDSYLGLPMFENTLVRTWDGHPEYEFRDISYSGKGLAVYHGWFPLYSIAAALRLGGVEPDQPGRKEPRTDEAEIRARSYLPRVPSVIFGVISLLALWAAARRLYGSDAGLAVLVLAAFGPTHVEMSTQARYYAATMAAHSLCAWMFVLVWQEGGRRHWIGLSLAFILLFHSHLLTFAVAGAAFLWLLPFVIRQPGFWSKISIAGAIGAVLTVPWLFLSGFLSHSNHLPAAWDLLRLPDDLFEYPKARPAFASLYIFGLLVIVTAVWIRDKHPRIHAAFGTHIKTLVWLYAWMIAAYAVFFFSMPAPSFFYSRISVPLVVPAVLLAGVILAGFVRLFGSTRALLLVIPVTLIFLFNSGVRLPSQTPAQRADWNSLHAAIGYLSKSGYDSNTKLYATPSEHLVLTYYTGLPVQSVAPVRKEYLDSYPAPVILFEKEEFHSQPAAWTDIQSSARAAGVTLSQSDAELLAAHLGTHEMRKRVAERVASVSPPLGVLPPYVNAEEFERQRDDNERAVVTASLLVNPMFHGMQMRRFSDWWKIFFYRFVDPTRRMGSCLNYAERIKNSNATVVPGWVIYRSPRPPRRNGNQRAGC